MKKLVQLNVPQLLPQSFSIFFVRITLVEYMLRGLPGSMTRLTDKLCNQASLVSISKKAGPR